MLSKFRQYLIWLHHIITFQKFKLQYSILLLKTSYPFISPLFQLHRRFPVSPQFLFPISYLASPTLTYIESVGHSLSNMFTPLNSLVRLLNRSQSLDQACSPSALLPHSDWWRRLENTLRLCEWSIVVSNHWLKLSYFPTPFPQFLIYLPTHYKAIHFTSALVFLSRQLYLVFYRETPTSSSSHWTYFKATIIILNSKGALLPVHD